MSETITTADDAKIQAAVAAFLDVTSQWPDKTEELVYTLRHKLRWRPVEIIELLSRVVDALLEQRTTTQ